MNKRRREILAALEPAVQFAMSRQGGWKVPEGTLPPKREVPGLHMKARVSADAPAELMVYGRIGGDSWFGDGISATDVATLLREVGPGPINVRINSGGGDAFQGVAIHTLLARHPGLVHTFNDGLAASAASIILMAGDEVTSSKYAMTMLHDGMTGPYGNAKTLRRSADLLDQVSQTMAELYADRAGEDAEFWREVMTRNEEDGTWYTGTEALAAGLVDHLTESDDEGQTAKNLSGWLDCLPTAAASFVAAHLKEEPSTEPEPATGDEPQNADREWAFAALAAGIK